MAAVCATLQVCLARGVFLFWDDYYFLGEAGAARLDWDYLSSSLFTHFSPVTRLANWVVVGHIAAHPWVIPAAQGLMLTAVVCSATWLLAVLFDRSGAALLGSVLLGVSLTLVPLGSWWTAGANILPGMAGFLTSFACSVLVLRGRSRWWAVPALLGAAVGVLDYETPILLPGYLALWLLLFGLPAADVGLAALLRRTWWLWAGLIAITGGAAINYRLNYYVAQPAAPPGALGRALVHSLTETLVPTALGLHAPYSGWFTVLTAVVGWLCTVILVGWLLTTRRGAWRGLAFAGAGWLLPTLALLLNRLERYGSGVADDAIYFYLPTVLALIGVLEAWSAPRRRPARTHGRRPALVRVAVPTALVALVAAYVWSVEPTSTYRIPPGADGDFVAHARSSAAEVRAEVGRFSVIDSLTHSKVMPDGYGLWSRDSNVLGLTVPGLRFADPRPPYYRFDHNGDLRAASVDQLAGTPAGRITPQGALQVAGAEKLRWSPEHGTCFTAGAQTIVVWRFDQVDGDDLVVRVRATVDAESDLQLVLEPVDDGQMVYPSPSDFGLTTLSPSGTGWLEIVSSKSMVAVQLSRFTPGVDVCLQSIDVAQVQSAAGP